jgi:hypothetical protein
MIEMSFITENHASLQAAVRAKRRRRDLKFFPRKNRRNPVVKLQVFIRDFEFLRALGAGFLH